MTDGRPWAPVPLARGSHGAVVAPHHLASAAGLSVLRAGGSAVDAAIATNAVLGVVMPSSCGLGGDAFWLIWDAATGRQHALNGSGRAPASADAASLRDRGLRTMPLRGPLAITVPGAVRSWGDAHRRFGRLSREAILTPAIELARDGFPASDDFIAAVERTTPIVGDTIGQDAGFFDVFRPNGRPWRPGERVRLPALAATLATLASDGFDAFYEGDLADRQARGLAVAGSPIARSDLERHRSDWGDPISIDYRGVQVTSHPPNSSGVVALELLSILGQFEPPGADGFGQDGMTDPAWIHRGIEAAKLAMADRDAYLTDPAFREVPVARLLDPAYAGELAKRIDPRRAARPLPAANRSGGGTVYLAAVDGDGNAVSLIESNYLGFGSGVVDPGTGIHYQNRGSYFSLDPSHPNVLEPGKRTLHTLLPGMLFRPDLPGPWIVAGSMGGDAQPQVHAQLVSAVVDGGLDVRTAVAVPRWFVEPAEHFAPPDQVWLEARHRPGIAEALAALGHP
ncbi:MAG TPA: gamma-glutamyltransferase family protein, partial [Candidatus Limnocylindrales bacterium]|nr:gamma-glutamyltransferase family protein [Candidatus Limnocylindrales bacterium]